MGFKPTPAEECSGKNLSEEATCRKPGAGRPKDERKHAAILQAAREHFLCHGFERANMDAIADSAGVSKLTIYSHFQNKETLFKQVIRAKCSQFACEEIYIKARAMPLKQGLQSIALAFLHLVTHAEALQMHRVVMSECARHPKMATLFYEAGPVQQKEAFMTYLKYAQSQKWVELPSIENACEQFFALLKGGPYMRLLLALEPIPTAKQIDEHAHDCVQLFIRGYGF